MLTISEASTSYHLFRPLIVKKWQHSRKSTALEWEVACRFQIASEPCVSFWWWDLGESFSQILEGLYEFSLILISLLTVSCSSSREQPDSLLSASGGMAQGIQESVLQGLMRPSGKGELGRKLRTTILEKLGDSAKQPKEPRNDIDNVQNSISQGIYRESIRPLISLPPAPYHNSQHDVGAGKNVSSRWARVSQQNSPS